MKWCQDKVKEVQPSSTSGAAAPSSGSLITKPFLYPAVKTHQDSFWNHFTTLVASKVEMANVEKLSYLKMSLKGYTAHIVSSLFVTDENYDIAKRKLEERALQQKAFDREGAFNVHVLPAVRRSQVWICGSCWNRRLNMCKH